jgi:hypothetical protein
MALSNTGTLSVDLDDDGAQNLTGMLKEIDKALLMAKVTPFSLIKKSIKRTIMKSVSGQLTGQERTIMSEFCDEMDRTLTKDYEIHMASLLKDLQNHWNMQASDFARFDKKVLLILSDDDATFNASVKQALIDVMPSPQVVTDIRGGHLALLLKLDRYVQTIKAFIDSM